MKWFLFLCCLLPAFLFAQTKVYIDDHPRGSDDVIRIDTRVSFPDVKVELGRNIAFEDFTVAVTTSRVRADIIITKREIQADQSVRIDNRASFPDFKILYGDDVSFPDVRIKYLGENPRQRADLLIFTENTSVSDQEIIACLLPQIKEKLAND